MAKTQEKTTAIETVDVTEGRKSAPRKSREGKVSQQTFAGCVQEVRMVERFCENARAKTFDDRLLKRALATQEVCDALGRAARSGQVVEIVRR